MDKLETVFDDWSEAFDLCREVNRPIVATVTEDGITETCKIYPSGSYKIMARSTDDGRTWETYDLPGGTA